MTDDSQDLTIGNAGRIIEKFGGIRPMANKMGVPVTTVQGWKQRNAIPFNRRDDIIRVASANMINLDDLLADITSPTRPVETTAAKSVHTSSRRESFETSMADESYKKPLLYAGILMLAGAIIGGVFAIAPKVQKMGQQEEQIRALQAELEAEKKKQQEDENNGLIPEGMKQTLTDLQGKVQDLSQKAETYTAIVEDLKTGTVEQRIGKLETHMSSLMGDSNAFALSGMLNKVGLMQQSAQGSNALDGIMSALLSQIQPAAPAQGKAPETLEQRLASLREKDPAVAQTFEGVAPEDMKAAVALIGLAQLRNSLMRDRNSFSTDLGLLKETLAKDDPELQAAIDRLAPQAQKGVLTPDGLSKEFRGLAGEIVAASLKGEDVQLQDKLKARLNDLMVVEKDGKQISGTPTQQAITEAQTKLDQGDVAGALVILQTLEGPAAQTAQPFMNEMQSTLMAGELQKMLGTNVLRNLLPKAAPGGMTKPPGQGLNGLIGQVKGMIPQGKMIHDPYSGMMMYVPGTALIPDEAPTLPEMPKH